MEPSPRFRRMPAQCRCFPCALSLQAADLREEAEALLGWLPFLQERVTHSSWRYIIPWFGIATWLYPGMGDSELGTTVASDSWVSRTEGKALLSRL